jgi:hypothetical protein
MRVKKSGPGGRFFIAMFSSLQQRMLLVAKVMRG